MKNFALIALLIVAASAALSAPVMHGIQQTLPYYVRYGLVSATEQTVIVQAIAEGKLTRKFVPITRNGTNYWIYANSGRLGSRPYPCSEDPLIYGYDNVKGRWARSLVVCGKEFIWFETCDNLFVPAQPWCPSTPAKQPCTTLTATVTVSQAVVVTQQCVPQPIYYGGAISVTQEGGIQESYLGSVSHSWTDIEVKDECIIPPPLPPPHCPVDPPVTDGNGFNPPIVPPGAA